MDRLKSIVAAVDFSPSSVAGLHQAARMAGWNDAALHVIHVCSPLAIVPGHDEGDLRELLAEADWPSETHLDLPTGDPVDLVLRKVLEVQADLLVMGIYGPLGAYTGHGPGTVARRCLRQAPCKVLLVQESDSGPYERVLGCIDFSETSDLAVDQSVRVAAQDRSELHLLHVVRENAPSTMEAEGRLAGILDRLEADASGLTVRRTVARSRSTADGILHYARQHSTDLIVLGIRGRTNLRYVLLGGTAERVMDELPCSVLAIKPRDFVSPFTIMAES